MQKFRFWLILIIFLHILLTLYHSGKGTDIQESAGGEQPQGQVDGKLEGNKDFKKFIEKPNNKKISIVKIKFQEIGKEKEKSLNKEKDTKANRKECGENFYYGIGVRVTFENAIISVAKGYAADRAGIKEGDWVEGFVDHKQGVFKNGTSFKGDENVGIDIFVVRNGKRLKFTIIREKICYAI